MSSLSFQKQAAMEYKLGVSIAFFLLATPIAASPKPHLIVATPVQPEVSFAIPSYIQNNVWPVAVPEHSLLPRQAVPTTYVVSGSQYNFFCRHIRTHTYHTG
jgi:hypothetical protein